MGRKNVDASTLLAVFASALEAEGVAPGQDLSREFMDDAIMVGCMVGPHSVENYLRQGTAFGFWRTNPKHGRGGRGSVTFLGTHHVGAVNVLG